MFLFLISVLKCVCIAVLPGGGVFRRPHLLQGGQLVAVEEQEVGGGVDKRKHTHTSEEEGRDLS